MTAILLLSERFIKDNSSISDNLAGKYIRAAIFEAQEVSYRRIIGDTLLRKLKVLVEYDVIDLPAAAPYKRLLEASQFFLLNQALVNLLPVISNKIVNAGVVNTPDEKVTVLTQSDIILERSRYQSKADACAFDLQNFLLNNADDYPELNDGERYRIKSNLYTAATCGLVLGGARGRWEPKPWRGPYAGRKAEPIIVKAGSFSAAFSRSFNTGMIIV